ncbi:hypothetical protein [Neobacillus sp. Marseille-QA0830]
MEEKKSGQALDDLEFEGKDKVFMDIDRMMNEGLSGGAVHSREDTANIEESHEFKEEQPPKS